MCHQELLRTCLVGTNALSIKIRNGLDRAIDGAPGNLSPQGEILEPEEAYGQRIDIKPRAQNQATDARESIGEHDEAGLIRQNHRTQEIHLIADPRRKATELDTCVNHRSSSPTGRC